MSNQPDAWTSSDFDYDWLDPRSSLPSVAELSGFRSARLQREALHRLVHAFRSAHGLSEQRLWREPRYENVVARYCLERVQGIDREAIAALSEPRFYANLRHGGTLLSVFPPLSAGGLELVCREIRAALVWLSEFKGLNTGQKAA